ncbi:MAG: WG repeat-containing protein [Candidatus Dadabacteria bacterium]|nr:WG repeat-containing protein [Candidatus Dadabacteria bacterium]
MSFVLLLLFSCSNEPAQLKIKQDNLYPVSVNDKWGLIDKNGNIVIKPKYDYIWEGYSEGMASVLVGNKWGYINRFWNMVIPPKYDFTGNYQNGLALVQTGKKKFYINRNGKYVMDYGPDKKQENKDYLKNSKNHINYLTPFKQDNKFGYKNKFGQIIIEAKYQLASPFMKV